MSTRCSTWVRWTTSAAIWASALLAADAAAVGFTITPSTVSADFVGPVALDVTGLTAGHVIRVESYIDLDTNDVIDPGDPLTRSFLVTDGQLPMTGGIRNTSMPGDEDGAADGQVHVVLHVPSPTELQRCQARYLVRVVPEAPPLAPVVAAFMITAPTLPQGVHGTVTSGGAPVPHAFVALGGTESWTRRFSGTLTDGTGQFSLPVPAGTYKFVAFATGHVTDVSRTVTIADSTYLAEDIALTPASRQISGHLVDAGTGHGIAGIQIFFGTEDAEAALTHTGPDGSFVIPVGAAAAWGPEPSWSDAALGGWLFAEEYPAVDTRAGNVSGVLLEWTRATALAHGRVVLDDDGVAEMPVYTSGSSLMGYCESGDDGDYACAVPTGAANIWTDEDKAAFLGLVRGYQQVTVVAGQAPLVNLELTRITSHLEGVVSVGATPLASVRVTACAGDDCVTALTAGDGTFDLAVFGGDWTAFVDDEELRRLHLNGPSVHRTVAAGQTLTGVVIPLLPVAADVSGDVRAVGGAPLAQVDVFARLMEGGLEYSDQASTDAAGHYELPLADGTWDLSLDCGRLAGLGYQCLDPLRIVHAGLAQQVDWILQPLPCAGDCNGDRAVSPAEVESVIDVLLSRALLETCMAADDDANGMVRCRDLVRVLLTRSAGCPGATGPPVLARAG